MTELLQNAVDLNAEYQDVEYSDELVRDWFDNLLDSYDKVWDIIGATPNDIGVGKVVNGSYETLLSTCDSFSRYGNRAREVHVYRCIEAVAKAFDIDLKSEVIIYDDGSKQDKYWFMYRGYKVFQLKSE